jgi:hypothetical protein
MCEEIVISVETKKGNGSASNYGGKSQTILDITAT